MRNFRFLKMTCLTGGISNKSREIFDSFLDKLSKDSEMTSNSPLVALGIIPKFIDLREGN